MSPKEQPASREQRQWQDAVRLKLSNEAAEAPLGVPLPLVDSTDVNLFSRLSMVSRRARAGCSQPSGYHARKSLADCSILVPILVPGADFGATHRSFPL